MTPDDIVASLRSAGCVFAEDEAALLIDAADGPAELAAMVSDRVAGRPLEYIVGWVAFGDLRIQVADGVFVPRSRTQLLAAQAARLVSGDAVLIEMCCGAGAVAATVASRVPTAQIVACDIDPIATDCARRNLSDAQVCTGDLFDALPDTLRGRVGVIAANAPYVPTDAIATMPREARQYEPRTTLDGGPDGLDIARRIVVGAPDWLGPGGHLLIETSTRQAGALCAAMVRRGFDARTITDEDNGGTVAVAALP
ncbi:putative protein N(5)-glutamine methyltransferase [Williamsia phyllosphaerae]|uniref:peptide chain release factor N(5)-glutamine methyltransferase n=1 Tax=Williamsia phyllosphaerae TaxID=885042 RepID=A0ABQ1UFQ1_9NOCA|nr:putative protein N(5)-glutamine methyltransferase [Williamsia phyllosphaerae]GGF17799.1 N5-glutamine S-adenosyl-L-methionine-dependent methyltransferase [Williamsia phyllosphaerae]